MGNNHILEGFFIMFDANMRCRQFIRIDGCHLKGLYKSVLLTVISIGANYGIYPLALCIVESQNTKSWVYFMERLYEQIRYNGGDGLCFMSERHKVILKALDRVFPAYLKRYCYRHIYVNFKERFPSLLLKFSFWNVEQPTQLNSTIIWQSCIILVLLHIIGLSKFQLAIGQIYVPYLHKCSHVTNNMTESFNN